MNKDSSTNRNSNSRGTKENVKMTQDLPDSPHDAERLKPETVILNLPDVSDIPGQEHIHVPPLGELADTTISSDDEEGASVFDDGHEEDFAGEAILDDEERDEADEDGTALVMGTDADVSDEERELLRKADEDLPTKDNISLIQAALDDTDFEGDPLNEGSFGKDVSGTDLDVPGAEEDDPNEEIGEEDEENNPYSLGGEKEDGPGERTS